MTGPEFFATALEACSSFNREIRDLASPKEEFDLAASPRTIELKPKGKEIDSRNIFFFIIEISVTSPPISVKRKFSFRDPLPFDRAGSTPHSHSALSLYF